MSAVDLAVAQLRTDEGYEQKPYKDEKGNLTVGYGFCVNSGLSVYAAKGLLMAQTAEIQNALSAYYWWSALDDARAAAVLNIAFNVGVVGLLHYVQMLSAIAKKDWQAAHDECLDSDAARLNVDRYKRLAQVLLLGAPNVAAA